MISFLPPAAILKSKRTLLCFVILLSLCNNQKIFSQQENFLKSSLYSPSDSKTLILGGSVIANDNEPQDFKTNPASISFAKNIILTSNYIRIDKNEYLYNAGVILPTGIGNWGLNFSKFDGADYFYDWMSLGDLAEIKGTTDNTITLSYGNNLIGNLNLGANINFLQSKTTDFYNKEFNASQTSFDFGLIYSFPKLIDIKGYKDKLNFGMALQGIGGKFNYHNYEYNLPKYLKLGFMYRASMPDFDNYELVSFTLNWLYRNYLNSDATRGEASQKDSWSLGLETCLYEHVNILIGSSVLPYSTSYSEKEDIVFSYGLGLIINIEKVKLLINAGYTSSEYNIGDAYTLGINVCY